MSKHCDSIKNMQAPKSKEQVQVLLGYLAYLSPFIPSYSEKTKIFSSLLEKTALWNWTKYHDEALQRLKDEISIRSIIYFHRRDLPTYLAADASSTTIAGVLYQTRSYDQNTCNCKLHLKKTLAISVYQTPLLLPHLQSSLLKRMETSNLSRTTHLVKKLKQIRKLH
jgi:hypothetical protein